MTNTNTTSAQMTSLMARYGVTTERNLVRAIAREYSAETGERFTQRDAELMLDGMLEAEHQRIEGDAYVEAVEDAAEDRDQQAIEDDMCPHCAALGLI